MKVQNKKRLSESGMKISFGLATKILGLMSEIREVHAKEDAFGVDVWERIAKEFKGKRDRWFVVTPKNEAEEEAMLRARLAEIEASKAKK